MSILKKILFSSSLWNKTESIKERQKEIVNWSDVMTWTLLDRCNVICFFLLLFFTFYIARTRSSIHVTYVPLHEWLYTNILLLNWIQISKLLVLDLFKDKILYVLMLDSVILKGEIETFFRTKMYHLIVCLVLLHPKSLMKHDVCFSFTAFRNRLISNCLF